MNKVARHSKFVIWMMRILNIVSFVLFLAFAFLRYSIDYYFQFGIKTEEMNYWLSYGIFTIVFFLISILLFIVNIKINHKQSYSVRHLIVIIAGIILLILFAVYFSFNPNYQDGSFGVYNDNPAINLPAEHLPSNATLKNTEEQFIYNSQISWKNSFWDSTGKYALEAGEDATDVLSADTEEIKKRLIVATNYLNSPYRSKEAYLKKYMLKDFFDNGQYQLIKQQDSVEVYEGNNMYASIIFKNNQFHLMLVNKEYWNDITVDEITKMALSSWQKYQEQTPLSVLED